MEGVDLAAMDQMLSWAYPEPLASPTAFLRAALAVELFQGARLGLPPSKPGPQVGVFLRRVWTERSTSVAKELPDLPGNSFPCTKCTAICIGDPFLTFNSIDNQVTLNVQALRDAYQTARQHHLEPKQTEQHQKQQQGSSSSQRNTTSLSDAIDWAWQDWQTDRLAFLKRAAASELAQQHQPGSAWLRKDGGYMGTLLHKAWAKQQKLMQGSGHPAEAFKKLAGVFSDDPYLMWENPSPGAHNVVLKVDELLHAYEVSFPVTARVQRNPQAWSEQPSVSGLAAQQQGTRSSQQTTNSFSPAGSGTICSSSSSTYTEPPPPPVAAADVLSEAIDWAWKNWQTDQLAFLRRAAAIELAKQHQPGFAQFCMQGGSMGALLYTAWRERKVMREVHHPAEPFKKLAGVFSDDPYLICEQPSLGAFYVVLKVDELLHAHKVSFPVAARVQCNPQACSQQPSLAGLAAQQQGTSSSQQTTNSFSPADPGTICSSSSTYTEPPAPPPAAADVLFEAIDWAWRGWQTDRLAFLQRAAATELVKHPHPGSAQSRMEGGSMGSLLHEAWAQRRVMRGSGHPAKAFQKLKDVFSSNPYLMWENPSLGAMYIVLKVDELLHAYEVCFPVAARVQRNLRSRQPSVAATNSTAPARVAITGATAQAAAALPALAGAGAAAAPPAQAWAAAGAAPPARAAAGAAAGAAPPARASAGAPPPAWPAAGAPPQAWLAAGALIGAPLQAGAAGAPPPAWPEAGAPPQAWLAAGAPTGAPLQAGAAPPARAAAGAAPPTWASAGTPPQTWLAAGAAGAPLQAWAAAGTGAAPPARAATAVAPSLAAAAGAAAPSPSSAAVAQGQPLLPPAVQGISAAMPLMPHFQALAGSAPHGPSQAEVVLIDLAGSTSGTTRSHALQLQDALDHLSACHVLAMDCEHGEAVAAGAEQNGGQQRQQQGQGKWQEKGKQGTGVRIMGKRQLAMVQFLAPAVTVSSPSSCGAPMIGSSSSSSSSCSTSLVRSWPQRIYLLGIPEQSDAAAAVVKLLQPLLEGSTPIKVVHDARQDAAVLQEQFGIHLAGLWDTQLLHALTSFLGYTSDETPAAASSSSSTSSAATGNSSRGVGGDGPQKELLGRIGLGDLLQLHGRTHVNKGQVSSAFAKEPRLFFQRPLPQQLLDYAADDVRHLLAVAASQLQLLPTALQQLGNLHAHLPKQQLRLTQATVSGYSQLLKLSRGAGGTISEGSTALKFEMQLDEDYVPSFSVYLRERPEQEQSSSTNARKNTSSSWCGSSSGNSESFLGEGQQPGPSGSGPSAAAVQCVDAAVADLLAVLPPRLSAAVAPYGLPGAAASLVEIVMDQGRPVELFLSDKSSVQLPLELGVGLEEALDCLAAAKRGHLGRNNLAAAVGATAGGGGAGMEAAEGAGRAAGVAEDCKQGSWPHLRWIFSSKNTSQSSNETQNTHQETNSSSSSSGGCGNQSVAAADRALFGTDNRMGLPHSLHRISAIRNKAGAVCGLTFRVGRAVPGAARLILDILARMRHSLTSNSSSSCRVLSLLLLGRPGVGKTTLLRDVARLLSESREEGGLGLRVVVVDTSNEIAGDADEVHGCIGRARRMMVRRREQQAEVMREAVQNHSPDVVVIDEIGSKEEVAAARTIAERGVLLVGTAHGTNLHQLMKNPDLRPLVGGVTGVTLGDVAAAATNQGNKVRLERAGAATFPMLLELLEQNRWRLHEDVEHSVDLYLSQQQQQPPGPCLNSSSSEGGSTASKLKTQVRSCSPEGGMLVEFESAAAAESTLSWASNVRATAAATLGSSTGPGGDGPGASGPCQKQQQKFEGGWLVDLLHAAVHCAVAGKS